MTHVTYRDRRIPGSRHARAHNRTGSSTGSTYRTALMTTLTLSTPTPPDDALDEFVAPSDWVGHQLLAGGTDLLSAGRGPALPQGQHGLR